MMFFYKDQCIKLWFSFLIGKFLSREWNLRFLRSTLFASVSSSLILSSILLLLLLLLSTMHSFNTDEYFMTIALEQAALAIIANEIPVGCVFVHNDQALSKAYNDTNRSLNGCRHAEFVAVERILEHHLPSIFKDCTLYVTVEPCIMCAVALKILGIKRVVFGCGNDRFGGNGSVFSIHQDKGGYQVQKGVLKEEAIMLLKGFYGGCNPASPAPARKKPHVHKCALKERILSSGPLISSRTILSILSAPLEIIPPVEILNTSIGVTE
ncbi:tRNA-specific adenosine deaminase subunit tad2 [Neolecta irregularis DAH-3]|uniref:tRNA-specific adenosine deaminase subunit tad2 n=1 Tax=Neolecta irregularis (strain DAH-3) TaxID=1198029 RepID=A0A1U7LRL6_NEOID|nr:tRNA-specific adenosine deaminase subunit tad2 [Neolecta irregularis DAH-3]|eukprot:OLL25269.1 tRNA-specific adenosine deaminase subunit tad2 [Neolecta irregularis DAH-3]